MSTNEFYNNSDGLNLRFGLEAGKSRPIGVKSTMWDKHELLVSFTFADLAAADAVPGTQPLAFVPDNVQIIDATLYVKTVFTGSSAKLDIGLYNDDGDGTYSDNDQDGIDAAIAVTDLDAVGDIVTCDGALVGAAAAETAGTGNRPLAVVVGENDGNAFTAGEADLLIRWRHSNIVD